MQPSSPIEHQPNLLLDLPPLALVSVFSRLTCKERLLQVSKRCRDLLLDLAPDLRFKTRTAQRADELCRLLRRRKCKLQLQLAILHLTEEEACAFLYKLASTPRPNNTCAVVKLKIVTGRHDARATHAAGWGPLLGSAFPGIQSLVLSDCIYGFVVGPHFCSGLAACSQLCKLQLSNVSIPASASTDQLAQVLPQWLPNVQELTLQQGPLVLLQGLAAQLMQLTVSHKPSAEDRSRDRAITHQALANCKELVSLEIDTLCQGALVALLPLRKLRHVTVAFLGDLVHMGGANVPGSTEAQHSWETFEVQAGLAPLHKLQLLPLAGAQRVTLCSGLSIQVSADPVETGQRVAAGVAALGAAGRVTIHNSVTLLWAPGAEEEHVQGQPAAALCAALSALQPLLLDRHRPNREPLSRSLHVTLPTALPQFSAADTTISRELLTAIEHACGSGLQQVEIWCRGFTCSPGLFAALAQGQLPALSNMTLWGVAALSPAALCALAGLCATCTRPLYVGLLTEDPRQSCVGLHAQAAAVRQGLVGPSQVRVVVYDLPSDDEEEEEDGEGEGEGMEGEGGWGEGA